MSNQHVGGKSTQVKNTHEKFFAQSSQTAGDEVEMR